ncbi:TonB family protein / TonB-dependent receptor [Minicystis rosea]|nr:TonB family protein / TonB-dependent receptor [Minicystis rosea]
MSWRSNSTCRDGAALALALLVTLTGRLARADDPPPASPYDADDDAPAEAAPHVEPEKPAPSPASRGPLEVSVRAAAAPREPQRTSLSVEQARRVPGTGADPLKSIESLPGVTRTAFDGGKVVLWGAAAGDTRVYVDGVEIPALFHNGGLRGVVAGDLLQGLELVPGAYGADHGRALGGLVRLRTRELPEQGIHAVASADLLDAGALVSAAIGERLRIAIGGRASYLDRILAGVVPRVADFVPIPRYRDYQAKVSLALRPAESLDLVLLGSGDDLDRALASPDPARTRRERTSSDFHRTILRYARLFDDGTTVEVTPFLGRDRTLQDASFGDVPARRQEIAWKYGLRASGRIAFTPSVTATFGLDALATRSSLTRAGSLTIPPREGDLYVFGQAPGADVASDRWSSNVLDAAPYVIADLRFGPVTVTPGVRADLLLLDGSRATPRVGDTPAIGFSRLTVAVDPRVTVRVSLSDRVSLVAAGGVYHQPPAPADLGAVFGTPALSLQRAVHVSAGQTARLAEGFGLEVTGYFERFDHLVVRSRLPTPKLALALTQDGEGRSYGVQVLLRRQLRQGLFGWLAYTVGRSERRYKGDPSVRLFDEDRTHALAAVLSYERDGWGAGARFRYTTGAPRTPVTGSFYEATSGTFQPIFGAQNSDRLPDFYQLDLRAEKKIQFSRAALSVYLDVLNVTFHKNAEEVGYSEDWTTKRYITGLPILGVLGLRIEI